MQPKAKKRTKDQRYERYDLRLLRAYAVEERIAIAPAVSYCDAEIENLDNLPWSPGAVEEAQREDRRTLQMLATGILAVCFGLLCAIGWFIWRMLHG